MPRTEAITNPLFKMCLRRIGNLLRDESGNADVTRNKYTRGGADSVHIIILFLFSRGEREGAALYLAALCRIVLSLPIER
jgi:hypothetical protein